ncbi:MAG: hypothetical protein RLZZ514_704 [Actinomycetota bacterium]
MRVVIAGGTGSVGRAIAKHLANQGHEIVLLTRRFRAELGIDQIHWDGRTVDQAWARELAGSMLINLAGELVDRVPTKRNIDLLERSRVEPTLALVEASKVHGAPSLWLQMSTLAIYGDGKEVVLDDDAPAADGPRQMAGVAKAWEAAVRDASAGRLVILRTGIVLQKNTPALNRLVTITRAFLGGTVGSGKQWVSWIHIADFLRVVDFIIANHGISGSVNVTSPNPIQNRDMMRSLRRVLGRPWSPPTPRFAIALGSWILFRTDPQLALTGRRSVPSKLLAAGFQFEHTEFEEAVTNLLALRATLSHS